MKTTSYHLKGNYTASFLDITYPENNKVYVNNESFETAGLSVKRIDMAARGDQVRIVIHVEEITEDNFSVSVDHGFLKVIVCNPQSIRVSADLLLMMKKKENTIFKTLQIKMPDSEFNHISDLHCHNGILHIKVDKGNYNFHHN